MNVFSVQSFQLHKQQTSVAAEDNKTMEARIDEKSSESEEEYIL